MQSSPKFRHSASYTPSSFLKGFIPSAVLNNPNSSHENNNESPVHKYATTSANFTTPAHLSLYQNLIPPNLISMTRTESKRSNTLMIFRNKFESLKEVNIDPGANMTKKKFTGEQIRGADSLKTIICLVDRKNQEYDRKSRSKSKGSMFINDLWARDFESNVVRFSKIKKELKKENSQLHKPLNDKYNDIGSLYDKKHAHKQSDQDLTHLRTLKSVGTDASLALNDKSFDQGSSPVFLPRFLVKDESPKEKVINRFSSYVLGGSGPKPREASSPSTLKRKSTAIYERGVSLDGFRLSESPVARKRPTLLVQIDRKGSTMEGFSPLNSQDEEPVSPAKTMLPGSQTSLGKVLGCPASPQMSYTLNRVRWNEIRRSTSIARLERQESRMSRIVKNKSMSGLEGGVGIENIRRTKSKVSFSLKVETLEKDVGNEEGAKSVVKDLIGQCNAELKDSDSCVESLEKLKKSRVKSKEELQKEKLGKMRKKQYIKEFRNAIGYKEDERLARMNADWKVEAS